MLFLPEAHNHRLSIAALLIANIIPLIGVVLFEWNIFVVVFLYWLESAVIGFYNILKMIIISPGLSIFTVPFFAFHYGAFMLVHLIFIFALFGKAGGITPDGGFFPNAGVSFDLFKTVSTAFTALIVSHGISFFSNFLGKHEYEGADFRNQMMAPYRRIIVMHVSIIFGGWIALWLDGAVWALALMVVIKTVADFRAHLKEHARRLI